VISERTVVGNEYRDCLLREVDRSLFFSASHYRRSLDLMTISASPWAHVTLYYCSYFAARALIGMFGGWIEAPNMRIEPTAGTPGAQQFLVTRNLKSLSTFKGPHRMFWDFYYAAMASLAPWIPPNLSIAITPVSSNPVWQIEMRNSINYDTDVACELSAAFGRSKVLSGFPGALPGVLSTQFKVSQAAVELAFWFAKDFRIRTDGLLKLGKRRKRSGLIRELVYDTAIPCFRRNLMKGKFLI